MIIVDANIILRFLLNDVEDLSEEATEILEYNEDFVPNEVIAEIIYVLEKVYNVKNDEISHTLITLFRNPNVRVSDINVLEVALELYGSRKFDFVDTLLYGYDKAKGYKIYTFDKKLNKLLEN